MVCSSIQFDLPPVHRSPLLRSFLQDPRPNLLIRLLQIIIHHNLIMHPLRLRKLHLLHRLLQPLLHRLLAIRLPSPQPLLQNLRTRRAEEQKPRCGFVGRVCSDLLDALHFYVEDAGAAGGGDGFEGFYGGAVGVAAEGGVFDEAVGGDEGGEVGGRHEVVVFAVDFARARGACCVCREVMYSAQILHACAVFPSRLKLESWLGLT
jgi:hypothetical protein